MKNNISTHPYPWVAPNSRAPNMCSTFSGGFKLNLRYIYISRDDTSKNSLDLERAPGARSIDDEFLLVSYLVIEI